MKNFIIIPDEVIENIFIKLPAKSILRFKSISKYWHSVLSSQRFAASHSHYHHLNENEYSLVLIEDDAINIVDYSSLQIGKQPLDETKPVPVFAKKHSFPPPLQIFPSSWRDGSSGRLYVYSGRKTEFFCYCNGMLCIDSTYFLHYEGNDVNVPYDDRFLHDHVTVLWNPCTNEYRELPKLAGYPKPNSAVSLRFLGFVYDSTNSDYKVIRVESHYSAEIITTLDVFSLKSNLWTRMADNLPYIGREAMIINDDFFWLKRNRGIPDLKTYRETMMMLHGQIDVDEEEYFTRLRTKEKLFCFNFTTKLITELELPHMGENCNYSQTETFASLATNCLSFLANNGDLWLFKDGSWMNYVTIHPSFPREIGGVFYMKPLFFTKHNSIVMHASITDSTDEVSGRSSVQVIYHPQHSSFTVYRVHGLQTPCDRILFYNHTLVSPL